jgi:Spy/CpxP family protein refolding chaperone
MRTITLFAILSLCCASAAGAEEPKPQLPATPPLPDVIQQLHALYGLMADQLDLMASQQDQIALVRTDLLRAMVACSRSRPPVWSQPEH